MTRLQALLAPLALLALPAIAQDAQPEILGVELNGKRTNEAPLGSVVVLQGRNLHRCAPAADPEGRSRACRHEDVKVRVGDVDSPVLAATPETVTFLLPRSLWIAPGPAELRLEIAGGATSTPLFLAPAQERPSNHCGLPLLTFPPVPQAERAQPGDLLLLLGEALAVRDAGGATYLQIEGASARVSEDVPLAVEVWVLGRRRIDRRQVHVDRGRFLVTLGPYGPEWPLGEWWVRVSWEGWLGLLVRVGSEAEIADQREQLQAAIVGTGRLVVRKKWEGLNPIRTGWVR